MEANQLLSDLPTGGAVTLIMVRDSAAGLEVFLMKRNSDGAMADPSFVLPGGTVSEEDKQLSIAMGGENQALIAFKIAAIREVFEEGNILFAKKEGLIFSQAALRGLKRCREYLLSGRLSFPELVEHHHLQLLPEQLFPLTHWVPSSTSSDLSPQASCHCFLAVQPSNQQGEANGSEMVDTRWLPLSDIHEWIAEDVKPLFSVAINGLELYRFETLAQLLSAIMERQLRSALSVYEHKDSAVGE